MSHQLICDWLGLPSDQWPPAPHVLLGLKPDVADPELLERRVLECLAKVRCHQLAHPEAATEAMTLLSRAFVTLSPVVKEKPKVETPPPVVVKQPSTATLEPPRHPLDWLFRQPLPQPDDTPAPSAAAETHVPWRDQLPPPPVRRESVEPIRPEAPAAKETMKPAVLLPLPRNVPAQVPAKSQFDPVAPLVEAALASSSTRSGLGTRRALYQRMMVTRQLLSAWEQIGAYLGDDKKRLTRRTEATQLVKHLAKIRAILPDLPPMLGEAGQPGYLVLALASQQNLASTFQMLLPSQREELARDWRAGRAILAAHSQFLRQEVHEVRRKGRFGRALRALRAILIDHAGKVLLALAVVALIVALAMNAVVQARHRASMSQPLPERMSHAESTPIIPREPLRPPVIEKKPTAIEAKPISVTPKPELTLKPMAKSEPEPKPETGPEPVPEREPVCLLYKKVHDDRINSVAFSPDGRSIVSCSQSLENNILLLDVADLHEIRKLRGHERPVRSVAFSPDGRRIVSGSEDMTVRLWNVAEGKQIGAFEARHDDFVNGVTFSHDGTQVLSCSLDKTIRLWNAETGKEIRQFTGHTGSVMCAIFSPDDRWILSGSGDQSVRLWDARTGKEINRFDGHTGRVTSLAFSRYGNLAVSASSDNSIRAWIISKRATSEADLGKASALANLLAGFVPKEQKVVLGGTQAGYDKEINCVAFSPDQRYVLAGSCDSIVRLWDLATGQEIYDFLDPLSKKTYIWCLACTPQGPYAVTGNSDGLVSLWRLPR